MDEPTKFAARQRALARLRTASVGPRVVPRSGSPRVTEVLRMTGLSPDFSGVDADVLERAADRGTRIHALLAEAHQRGVPLEAVAAPASLPADIAPYWQAAMAFVADTQHVALHSEVQVEHPQWRYVGHLDRIGFISVPARQGLSILRCLLDWKCVAVLDVEAVAIQLAAYRLAWNVMFPTEIIAPGDCGAVHLKRDATYRLVMIPASRLLEAEQVWLAALTVYHARKRIGRTTWLDGK